MEKSISAEELVHIIDRATNKYIFNDRKPNSYGTGILLYHSEIHTIDAIGKNKDINITQLAQYQGITKGAVSQMVDKICRKGLVNKNFARNTENEVVLELTEMGTTVYNAHLQYHEKFYSKLSVMLEKLSPDVIATFKEIVIEFEKHMDDEMKG